MGDIIFWGEVVLALGIWTWITITQPAPWGTNGRKDGEQ